MSVDGLIAAVQAQALSPDSIRSLAYLLADLTGRRSDAIASMIGRQLSAGHIDRPDAEWLVYRSSEIVLQVL